MIRDGGCGVPDIVDLTLWVLGLNLLYNTCINIWLLHMLCFIFSEILLLYCRSDLLCMNLEEDAQDPPIEMNTDHNLIWLGINPDDHCWPSRLFIMGDMWASDKLKWSCDGSDIKENIHRYCKDTSANRIDTCSVHQLTLMMYQNIRLHSYYFAIYFSENDHV